MPGSCLLISCLPGLALRAHVESPGKPGDSTSVLKTLPGNLDIKRHSPTILYTPVACANNGYRDFPRPDLGLKTGPFQILK